MDGLLTIAFEAHNPAANHHRWYEARVGRDLFGEWTLCLTYGRTARPGQHRRYAGTAAAMQARLRDHLLRRLSAPRRIGCPYRVIHAAVVPGLDPAAWLPPDVMARFGGDGGDA